MTCGQVDKLKEAYVDGRLAPGPAAQVAAHAAGCPGCARRIALARQVRDGLGLAVKTTLGAPALAPVRAARLHTRVVRQAGGPPSPTWRRPAFALALPVVALLMLAAM